MTIGTPLLIPIGFYYQRFQECDLQDFVSLNEGPYITHGALKFGTTCDFYSGVSGAPVVSSKKLWGLANTSVDRSGGKPDCVFGMPCELGFNGLRESMQNGQSYGVPLEFLYKCFSKKRQELDFSRRSCPFHFSSLKNQE